MRYEDWAERLEQYIESKRYEPFKWGANDCALFARGAVDAIQIEPTTAELKMGYKTSKGALKWLLEREAADLWEFVDKHFDRTPVTLAGRGDLIGHITTDKSIGVSLGDKFVTPSDNGLVFASLDDAVTAWRVK